MKFLAPLFFWSFLSFIPLVAIYFLKVRPRRKETTAYFLWSRVFTEKKATSLFNRLRDMLSLILLSPVVALGAALDNLCHVSDGSAAVVAQR